MIEVRCKNCNKLLAKATSMVAAIKCPKCKMLFEYKVFTELHMTNLADPNETKKVLQAESK